MLVKTCASFSGVSRGCLTKVKQPVGFLKSITPAGKKVLKTSMAVFTLF
jgi:hypothetical protein